VRLVGYLKKNRRRFWQASRPGDLAPRTCSTVCYAVFFLPLQ